MNNTSRTVTGRDFYAGLYHADVDAEAKWLDYGASEKAASVRLLIKQGEISSHNILELGCGTGAVITECARLQLASTYTGVDFSSDAIGYLKARNSEIRCLVADITASDFVLNEHFDVLILSHVLEHLEDPLSFLKAVKEKLHFSHLIAEVPLEDLFMSRIKSRFVDRANHPSGHVQFYTPRTFKKLLVQAGFTIKGQRWFVPRMSTESIRFTCALNHSSETRTVCKLLTVCHLPRILGPAWKRFWYGHLPVRCTI